VLNKARRQEMAVLFHNLGIKHMWVVRFTVRPICTRDPHRTFGRKLCEPQCPSEHCGEDTDPSSLSEMEPQFLNLDASLVVIPMHGSILNTRLVPLAPVHLLPQSIRILYSWLNLITLWHKSKIQLFLQHQMTLKLLICLQELIPESNHVPQQKCKWLPLDPKNPNRLSYWAFRWLFHRHTRSPPETQRLTAHKSPLVAHTTSKITPVHTFLL
jgi:hypothetical protein